MSSASVWVGAVLLAVIVLAHHDLFHAEIGVASRLSALVDRTFGHRAGSSSTPTIEHLLFLAGLVLGGFVVAFLTQTFSFRPGVASRQFSGIFEGRVDEAGALFMGGLFVGTGMRMAASSLGGHGLLALSRFDRSTIVATLVFFAIAIAIAFGLEAFR